METDTVGNNKIRDILEMSIQSWFWIMHLMGFDMILYYALQQTYLADTQFSSLPCKQDEKSRKKTPEAILIQI